MLLATCHVLSIRLIRSAWQALQELHKQIERIKQDKEEACAQMMADKAFLTTEASALRQRIAQLQSGGGSGRGSASDTQLHFEIEQVHPQTGTK